MKVGDLVQHTRNGIPAGPILVVTAQKFSATKNEFVKLSGKDVWFPMICMEVLSAVQ